MSTNVATEDKLAYTYAEAGRAIGLSPRSIWSLVKAKKLRACKIGRSVRIPHSALVELLGGAADVLEEAPR